MKETTKDIDVLVIGRACVDFISVVERFPEEDSKVPLEMRLVEGGGQATTSSCCISRLGGRVAYVGSVGDDDEGRFCLKRLSDFGVDTSTVRIVHGAVTPVAYVFITKGSGRRTIVYERSSLPRMTVDESLQGLIARSRVLMLDPQTTYLAGSLKCPGTTLPAIVYDCERWGEGVEDMMGIADYFIPSSEFLRDGSGKISGSSKMEKIRTLAGRVSGVLVVTDGEQGAYYLDGGNLLQVLPPAVGIRDTTGAGDNFHASFALAMSRGLELADAVRFSVAVATLSCRSYGGREGVPEFEEAVRISRTIRTRILTPSS